VKIGRARKRLATYDKDTRIVTIDADAFYNAPSDTNSQ